MNRIHAWWGYMHGGLIQCLADRGRCIHQTIYKVWTLICQKTHTYDTYTIIREYIIHGSKIHITLMKSQGSDTETSIFKCNSSKRSQA